jgi:hypothetical protein
MALPITGDDPLLLYKEILFILWPKTVNTEENMSSCVFYVLHRQWLGVDWGENPPKSLLNSLRHLKDFSRSIGRQPDDPVSTVPPPAEAAG